MEREQATVPIQELHLFDTCVTLGTLSSSAGFRSLTAESALDTMDRYDIAEALVVNSEARVRYPREMGNRRLLEWLDGTERLHPVWVLDPVGDPDLPTARGMVEDMLDAGVRVARLMMGIAPPFLWLWDNLCTALEEHHVPCLLDFADTGRFSGDVTTQSVPDDATVDKLREVCIAHPRLPMILSHVSGGLGLAFSTMTLLRRAPNLHIDTTSIGGWWRRVVTELGAERVVFGSGTPIYDPGMVVSIVQYSDDVDLATKKAIYCGNTVRLMEAVR